MDEPGWWATLAIFAFVSLLSAVAAAGQATLYYISRTKLRHLLQEGAPRVQAVQRAVEEPAAILSASVVIYAVTMAGAVASGLLLALNLWQLAPWAGIATALVLLAALLLLQLFARALAMYRPERSAKLLMGPLRVLSLILWPLVAPTTALERRVLQALQVPQGAEPNAAEEELRLLVEAAEENGALEEEEREMIHGIFQLSERPVREIMVPRIDIAALERRATVRDALDKITATGHTRIPVYDGNVDNVVGILHAKDVLRYLRTGSLDSPAESLARPAYFVPETKKIDELLHELQQKRTHLAIVVDEYGGTAGLITIEDMLEEIVGEIQDEYDVEEALFERISEQEAIFDARMNLRDVEHVLDFDLEGELEEHEYDTLGGLVYERLGKVPVAGDEVRVNGCLISVLSTDGHRIKKVRVLCNLEPVGGGEQTER